MAGTIQLTIYNREHEPVKELKTAIVPWGIMKRAVKLAKTLKIDDSMDQKQVLEALDDDSFDTLTALVADVFHDQVTIAELEWGTETLEMLTVLQAVVTRAFSELGTKTPDPPIPGKC